MIPAWLQPTSTVTIAAIGVVTVAVWVWTISHVPARRALPTWRTRIRILFTTLACTLTALLVLAMALNYRNDWYPTWGSIVRSATVSDTAQHGAVRAQASADSWVRGTPSALQSDPTANPAFASHTWSQTPGTELITTAVDGAVSGVSAQVVVYLPPSYLAHPERYYPVVVALPGVPGNPDAYKNDMELPARITTAYDEQKIREFITVIPDVFPDNYDTECVDSVDGKTRMDTFVSTDLTYWIKSNLRAVNDPDAWATLGYSAGGWCSSMFTVRHPSIFKYSINMSGYFQPIFDGDQLREPFDPEYDLAQVIHTTRPDVAIWYWGAEDDRIPTAELERVTPSIQEPTTLVTTLLANGGHSWTIWQDGCTQALAWLGATSPYFAWEQA